MVYDKIFQLSDKPFTEEDIENYKRFNEKNPLIKDCVRVTDEQKRKEIIADMRYTYGFGVVSSKEEDKDKVTKTHLCETMFHAERPNHRNFFHYNGVTYTDLGFYIWVLHHKKLDDILYVGGVFNNDLIK